MKQIFLMLTAIAITVSSCKQTSGTKVVPPAEFNKMISEGGQILDVRSPEEFNERHIANAVNVDIDGAAFDDGVAKLYKDLPLYVYCGVGQRSHRAALRLSELGFKNVVELEGGLKAWHGQGLPMVATEPEKKYENDTIPFEKAIQGSKLVLVDFNATWCKPCRILQPTIERIRENRAADVIVYSIDVDERSDLATQYQAERIPLLLLFKDGKIVHRSEGVVEESVLNQVIDKNKS